jgi:hypothetical protein
MRALRLLLCTALVTAPAAAAPLRFDPHHQVPPELNFRTPVLDRAMRASRAAGTLQTLPSWSHSFAINGTTYSYTLLGTDPAQGPAVTVIPTLLVPFRITVSDYLVNGVPLVLDATPQMQDVINSPIFTAAKFDTGTQQFADAMLHAEFQQAPKGWHLLFAPSVAPTINVTSPAGAVTVQQAKNGKYLGIINNGNFLNKSIQEVLTKGSTPNQYVVFISYNSLFGGAFGFHSSYSNPAGTTATVWAYNSWLVGVDSLFSLPSPDADTFAHETAETVHDALGFSLTLEWGDWFNNNKCFQNYIEVGDAVEDASAKIQNYKEKVTIHGRQKVYTLQTEALLPWFERQYPSTAIHQAYSFPGETALLGPAPFTCVK